MRRLAFLAFAIASTVAMADPAPTSETVPCSGNVCTRAAMPVAATEGLALRDVRSYHVSVCAAAGQTLTGVGTIQMIEWDSFLGLPLSHSSLYFSLGLSATSCLGAACRCWVSDGVSIPDLSFRGNSVIAAAYLVGVSGGASITVTYFPTTSR